MIRPKLGSERDSEWRCCFCLHVRTGTILLGSWHLLLHMAALGFLAVISRDPQMIDQLQQESVPTPLSYVDSQNNPYPRAQDHSLIYHDVDVGALVTVCTLAITLMLVYGAARGKPAHLLPFFCLQIFDFAITVLTATGYMCYLRSIHRLVEETKRVPWRDQLLQLPAPALALLVLAAFLTAIMLKGYCISVVWRCYKYLTMRAHALHGLTPFVISERIATASGCIAPQYSPSHAAPVPPEYSSVLPGYEEAVKQSPPPTYRAATLMAAAADPIVLSPTTPTPEPQPQPQPQSQPQPPAANTVVMLPHNGAQARV